MMSSDPIPAQAWDRIKEFLKAKKTGSITLDVKDGNILAWKITESGRVHSRFDTNCKHDIKYTQT